MSPRARAKESRVGPIKSRALKGDIVAKLGIGSVAGQNVCCNFDDFGRIFAAEFLGRLIGEFLCGVRRDDAPALLAPGDHGIGKSALYEVGAIPLDI
jgi:hypothetical protein